VDPETVSTSHNLEPAVGAMLEAESMKACKNELVSACTPPSTSQVKDEMACHRLQCRSMRHSHRGGRCHPIYFTTG
jgi:hypothetical protein